MVASDSIGTRPTSARHLPWGPRKDAELWRVPNNGLAPRVRAGEFVIVEPSAKISPGDDVVIVFTGLEEDTITWTVQRLIGQSVSKIDVESVNGGDKDYWPVEYIAAMYRCGGRVPGRLVETIAS
jgi:phage repressor protein C with HTH and peptisase S24 domain